MHIKIHKSYRPVVSLCDSDIIGKKFETEKLQLDIRESFYKSESDISKEEVIKILIKQKAEDSTFNIVGPESIQTAIEAGIITEEHVGEIGGMKYALTLI